MSTERSSPIFFFFFFKVWNWIWLVFWLVLKSWNQHSSRSHLYVDIGDASSSLWGSTSSHKYWSGSQLVSVLTTCTLIFQQVCTVEPSFFTTTRRRVWIVAHSRDDIYFHCILFANIYGVLILFCCRSNFVFTISLNVVCKQLLLVNPCLSIAEQQPTCCCPGGSKGPCVGGCTIHNFVL